MFVYCELENELKLKPVLQRCPEWYAQLSEIPNTMIAKGKEKGCVCIVFIKKIILEVLLNLHLKN